MSDVLCGCGAMHHGNLVRDRLLIVLHALVDEDFDWTDADEFADALLPVVRAFAAEQLRAAAHGIDGSRRWDTQIARDLRERAGQLDRGDRG